MYFVLNYNEGYEVGVVMLNDDGYPTTFPLRNFGERQGDAKIYQHIDCPKLSMPQIRMLIKNFDRSAKYERLKSGRFMKDKP